MCQPILNLVIFDRDTNSFHQNQWQKWENFSISAAKILNIQGTTGEHVRNVTTSRRFLEVPCSFLCPTFQSFGRRILLSSVGVQSKVVYYWIEKMLETWMKSRIEELSRAKQISCSQTSRRLTDNVQLVNRPCRRLVS